MNSFREGAIRSAKLPTFLQRNLNQFALILFGGVYADPTDLTSAHIAKGSICLALQNTLSTLIAVSGFAFMARMITQEEMGVIAGLTLLTSLATLISDFGLKHPNTQTRI